MGGYNPAGGWDPTSGIYGGLGGYYNPSAAKAGVGGPAAMSFNPGGGGQSPQFPGMDINSMLAQILQQGPQPDQALLDSSLADLDAQQANATNQLKNRFSGAGRPLASTEYGSQESELLNAFNRSRSAARANASQAGLQKYSTTLNPLMMILKMMQTEGPLYTQPGMSGGVSGFSIPRY